MVGGKITVQLYGLCDKASGAWKSFSSDESITTLVAHGVGSVNCESKEDDKTWTNYTDTFLFQ